MMTKLSIALPIVASLVAWGMPERLAGASSHEPGTDVERAIAPVAAAPLQSSVTCSPDLATVYAQGEARAVAVMEIDGHLVERAAGRAFLKMQSAAREAGVHVALREGLVTHDRQWRAYKCFKWEGCAGALPAAHPGYGEHETGRVLDLTPSAWLTQNAARFGFRRPHADRAWHYVFAGSDPGGPCE